MVVTALLEYLDPAAELCNRLREWHKAMSKSMEVQLHISLKYFKIVL